MAVTTPTSATGLVGALDADETRASARPAWMEAPNLPERIVMGVLLALIALVMIFPFVYVVAVSFSSAQDVLAGGLILWPKNPSLEAYQAIARGGIVAHALGVSVGLVLIGTTVK